MKKYLPAFAIVLACFAALVFFIRKEVVSNNEYRTTHFAEVKSEVGADGRAAVGSPAVVKIYEPSASIYKRTKNVTFEITGWLCIVLIAAYLYLYGTGKIIFGVSSNAPGLIFFVLMVLAAASFFAAFSSAFDNNYAEITLDRYNSIRDLPDSLSALFNKPLIK